MLQITEKTYHLDLKHRRPQEGRKILSATSCSSWQARTFTFKRTVITCFYLLNTEFIGSAFSKTSAPTVQIAICKRNAVKEGENYSAFDMNTAIHEKRLHKFVLYRFILPHIAKRNDSLYSMLKQLESIFQTNDFFLLKTCSFV